MSNLKTEYIVGVNTLDLFSYKVHEKTQEVPLIKEGVTWQDAELLEMFFDDLSKKITIQPRYRFEDDVNLRHFITYDLFIQHKDNVPHILVYQRTKQAGEQRLGQKFSVGIGGHVELADVVHVEEDSKFSLNDVLRLASLREIQEEIYAGVHNWIVGTNAKPMVTGTVIDNSDSVGRVHIGISNVYVIPEDIAVSLVECPDHREVGFEPLTKSLLDKYEFENWSKMLISALVDHPFTR